MPYIVKTIITLIVIVLMQASAVNMVSSTPAEAADDFLDALKDQDPKVMQKYMDNAYINFLCNTKGDEESIDRMNDALFKNFSYKIERVKKKDDVAVARVIVTSGNFSNVMTAYDQASYDYIMDNLDKEDIADKDKLNAKCLEIYVSEIEKAAESGEITENVVFIPMVDNGYYGWNIIMTDELMASVLGNL
ncbi:MAG: hypothetical protein IJC41_07170, partial [Firmicutes bacterium]|nr:hypothetical protein [Bacillota bacterium]